MPISSCTYIDQDKELNVHRHGACDLVCALCLCVDVGMAVHPLLTDLCGVKRPETIG